MAPAGTAPPSGVAGAGGVPNHSASIRSGSPAGGDGAKGLTAGGPAPGSARPSEEAAADLEAVRITKASTPVLLPLPLLSLPLPLLLPPWLR